VEAGVGVGEGGVVAVRVRRRLSPHPQMILRQMGSSTHLPPAPHGVSSSPSLPAHRHTLTSSDVDDHHFGERPGLS
jgi:hypothetical protein